MTEFGWSLIGEEHGPNALVETAVNAEGAGLEFALASDHFHPWLSAQGNSPFVWSTLGGITRETDDLRMGTGVTCPLIRIHPANVAQSAATVGEMSDGRFFLGVGTGENLNEHVVGERWPPHDVRLEMLEEAVEIIRGLWEGETFSHHGQYYTVENARIYTLPDIPPDIAVAASGPQSADVAGRIGDAFISTAPKSDLLDQFAEGGDGPTYGQVTVCWDESEQNAREIAHEQWANTALSGELGQVLPTTAHFEQATEMLSEEDVAGKVVCGPDAGDHIDQIETFVNAGYDYVSVHQVGPRQADAIQFYEEEVLPSF